MTSPLSLLAPLATPDPAQAPAPGGADDAALFAAALVAALQTAMVPTQAAPPVVATPSPTPTDDSATGETPQDAQSANGGEGSKDAEGAGQSDSGVVLPSTTSAGSKSAKTTGNAPTGPQGWATASCSESTGFPETTTATARAVAKQGQVSRGKMPATTQPGRLVWTPRLKGESASESIDAQDPGTPQQGQPASASTPAGAMPAPVLVEMSSAPQLPTPLESVAPAGSGPAGSAPADGACGKPASTREEKAASSGASNAAVPESPIAWRPVVPGTVPVPTAVAQMLAATPSSSDGKADSGPDAGSGTAADRYGDPAPKQGAPEAYLKISAAPSGDPRATSGSSEPCATGSDAGFVQAVAQILGDAEITDVRVTLGSSSAARRTGESGSAMTRADAGFAQAVTRILGNADLTNARVSLANSTAQVKRSESSLGDEHAAPSSAPQKAAAIATGSPSATGIVPERPRVIPRELVDRFSVGKRERADGTVNGEQTATAVSTEGRSAAGDSPRLLRDVIARLAADQIPALEQPKARAHDSASERTLPAPRQDLPASDDHPTAESSDSRTSGPERPKAASDVQASGSASPAGQNDASQKSDSRPREVVAGEARNLRDGVPTREQPAGVADRVTLQVADADGRQTRIRVSVLGDQVRAVIQPPDAEAARHLEHRMDELQGALVRQGFVNPRVTVQLAGTSAETGSPWGGAAGNGTSDRAPSRGTDQPAGDQRQGSGRREQERQGEGQSHSRQRSPQRDPRDRRR